MGSDKYLWVVEVQVDKNATIRSVLHCVMTGHLATQMYKRSSSPQKLQVQTRSLQFQFQCTIRVIPSFLVLFA